MIAAVIKTFLKTAKYRSFPIYPQFPKAENMYLRIVSFAGCRGFNVLYSTVPTSGIEGGVTSEKEWQVMSDCRITATCTIYQQMTEDCLQITA